MSYRCNRCGRVMPEVEAQIDLTLEVKETGEIIDATYYFCSEIHDNTPPRPIHGSYAYLPNRYKANFSCYDYVVTFNEAFQHGIKRKGVRRLTCRVNGTAMI